VVANIKFCGIMQTGDATVAAEAGAAYLGVVFAGGPRAVTVTRFVEAVFAHSSVT
jgi:phosphoribosylanthranilate isomerase